MWPFSKKLKNTDIVKGAIDYHCHVLPGVDDGIRNMEDTLRALRYYEEAGFNEIWFTPHVMEESPNTPEELKKVFAEVEKKYSGRMTLHLAAENMLDKLFEERLKNDELLTYGENSRYLLVETSYYSPPVSFWKILEEIKRKGYLPILAHPERYVYMDDDWYERLISMGIKLQLNIFSLQGAYGPEAKAKAKWLLKKGYYSIFGTDTHRAGQLKRGLHRKMKPTRLDLQGL